MPKPASNAPKSSLPMSSFEPRAGRSRPCRSSRRSGRCAASARASAAVRCACRRGRTRAHFGRSEPGIAQSQLVDVDGQRRNLRRIDSIVAGARCCCAALSSLRVAVASERLAGAPVHALHAARNRFALARRHQQRALPAPRLRPGSRSRRARPAPRPRAYRRRCRPADCRRCAVTSMRCSGSLPPPSPPRVSAIQSIASSVSARPLAIRPDAGAASSTRSPPSATRTPVCPLLLRARNAMHVAEADEDVAAAQRHGVSIVAASGVAGRLAQRRGQIERGADQVGTELQQRRRLCRLPGADLGIAMPDRPRRTACQVRLEPCQVFGARSISSTAPRLASSAGLEHMPGIAHEFAARAQRQLAGLAFVAHGELLRP